MKRFQNFVAILLLFVLAFAGCTKPDRSEEAERLSDELTDLGFENQELALARVDSAEQAGVFTAVHANTVKAMIYENVDQLRMAAYYAEKAIAAEAGHTVTTPSDSNLYCIARWILADGTFVNGEYGKSLSLAKEILAFVGDGASDWGITMKCRALSQIAECESELNHVDEAERLFLQCTDILMESTLSATSYADMDPLIYTLLSLNDLYIDNRMPERALPLMEKMDTAINRLARCSDNTDRVLQKRRNNVTISKAMVYAANNQREQAEALFHEHQQFQGLDDADITAEGVYLTMMGRYDEAVRLFDEADSIVRSSGDLVSDIYVKTLLTHKYDALQKAGRTAEALTLGDYMRQLTDSLRRQERQTDVEQLQEIQQQEEEIIRKRQSLLINRIVLVAAFLVCLFVAYMFWRAYQYNKVLNEKNRRLVAEIEQREHEQQQVIEQLESTPEDTLTANQQLYRRLCELMKNPDVFTNPDTNQDTLASLVGSNRTYIYDALRECANQTPTDFINGYRLRHAAHLLATTNDSVSLIAELCGLSRRTFYRLFNDAYSMSPADYRKVTSK